MNVFWVVSDENEFCDTECRENVGFNGREAIWCVYDGVSIEDDDKRVWASGLDEPVHEQGLIIGDVCGPKFVGQHGRASLFLLGCLNKRAGL